jgi:hypothetical protein
MSDLQTRAAELQSAGRVPLYGDGLTIVRPKLAKNLLLKLGPQPSGCFLYLLDLDNHTASQDAEAARRSLECALPHVAERIAWRPSRGHTRRPGLHGFFEAHKQLPTGRIYDAEGNHIGELIGGEQHTFDPGDLEIQTLTLTQIEHLLDFWTIQGGDVNGVRWSDRAKQGARWAKGYNRIRVTKAELRAFLTMQCGRVGITLDALFDEHTLFNRSDAAGNLMQTLML